MIVTWGFSGYLDSKSSPQDVRRDDQDDNVTTTTDICCFRIKFHSKYSILWGWKMDWAAKGIEWLRHSSQLWGMVTKQLSQRLPGSSLEDPAPFPVSPPLLWLWFLLQCVSHFVFSTCVHCPWFFRSPLTFYTLHRMTLASFEFQSFTYTVSS